MVAKKSILEKLKLVEKIDGENETELNEEAASIEESNQQDENEKKEDHIENSNNFNVKATNTLVNDNKKIGNTYMDRNIDINKVLSIEEIYGKFTLENDSTKTVFIIDEFFKALPGNLPREVRKQSVINIIKASGKDIDLILRDGENRVNILNNHLKEFSKKTEDSVTGYQMQIQQLMKEIEQLKNHINEREQLKLEQKSIIEFEMQRVDSIMQSVE